MICTPILHIDQPLRMRVSEVARVRRTEMNLGFGERVQIWHTLFIREDTGRQARDDFGHVESVCGV